MASKTQIFFTGATGYVGGSVLDRLLRHPKFTTSEITALVRKADKAPAFESIGVKTVIGSYDDHALLEKQASLSDVVFACADSDNAEACAAILRGLKTRHEASGKSPILIHTSGTAAIVDDTEGNYATDTIWDDTDVVKLDAIKDTQPHRNVDKIILAADKEGYVKTYIILPSMVYGFASGKLVDLGVQHTRSIQIPLVVTASIGRKRAGYVGKGLNFWPNVHVDDVADLYIVLYDAILEGRGGHGHEGLYFGENGHHLLREVSVKIGEALVELGVSDTAEPNTFTEEDYKKYNFFPFQIGTNCRCRSSRGRALGWNPKETTEDLLKSIKGEVEWQLKVVPKESKKYGAV